MILGLLLLLSTSWPPTSTSNGVILDEEDQAPIGGVWVQFATVAPMREGGPFVRRSDGDGRFPIGGRGLGPLRLSAWAPGYLPIQGQRIANLDKDVVLSMPRGGEARLRVLDAETRKPVAGASVAVGPVPDFVAGSLPLSMETDGDGHVTVRGLARGEQTVIVHHPDYVEGVVSLESGAQEVCALKKGHRIQGTVLDDDSRPASHARVRFQGFDMATYRYATTDAQGRYRSPPLASGFYFVSIGLDATEGLSLEHRQCHLQGDTATLDLGPSEDTLDLEGILVDAAGKALPNHTITILCDGPREATTDEEGRFRLRKIRAGSYEPRIGYGPMQGEVVTAPLTVDAKNARSLRIQMFAGTIEGRVLRKDNREPLRGQWPIVVAERDVPPFDTVARFACAPGGDFSLKGLPLVPIRLRAEGDMLRRGEGVVLDLAQQSQVEDFVILVETGR